MMGVTRMYQVPSTAYDYFLRGRAAFHLRTPAGMRVAVTAFERATELDPEYALAWASLGMAHAGRTINSDADPRVAIQMARGAAGRAVALDPELAEAQQAHGQVRWLLEWDWVGAEAAFRQATSLDPSVPGEGFSGRPRAGPPDDRPESRFLVRPPDAGAGRGRTLRA
jgi:tetratricopeptide (TPR) repeat protein